MTRLIILLELTSKYEPVRGCLWMRSPGANPTVCARKRDRQCQREGSVIGARHGNVADARAVTATYTRR